MRNPTFRDAYDCGLSAVCGFHRILRSLHGCLRTRAIADQRRLALYKGRSAKHHRAPRVQLGACEILDPSTGNNLLKDPSKRAKLPDGNLADGLAYIAPDYDDSSWRKLGLPHDYAAEGPFTNEIAGSVGRLPAPGVVWYRKNLNIPSSDAGKSYFSIWTAPCLQHGLAQRPLRRRMALRICLLSPEPGPACKARRQKRPGDQARQPHPQRFKLALDILPMYPGAGLYRNVWLVKTARCTSANGARTSRPRKFPKNRRASTFESLSTTTPAKTRA